jgi:epoxyqueuosine reductase
VEILDMTEGEFRERFRKSPVKRTRWAGLRRNAAVALGNIGDAESVPALVRALNGEPELVRGHAAWALGRVGGAKSVEALRTRRGVESDSWVLDEIELALAETAQQHCNTRSAIEL